MSEQRDSREDDSYSRLCRAWELSQHMLASKVSKLTFESYVRIAEPISHIGNVITLGVPSQFVREWLEKKTTNAIRSSLEFHLDTSGIEIRFVIVTRDSVKNESIAAGNRVSRVRIESGQTQLLFDDVILSEQVAAAEQIAIAAQAIPAISTKKSSGKPAMIRVNDRTVKETIKIPCLPLNEHFTLHNFQVGPSNRLAHAGAAAVAAQPGEKYNPLFLYGDSGLGKTHLMHAIAQEIKRLHPKLVTAYVSGEYFAQSYITALRERTTEEFRRQYRRIEVWLVDDIQFIATKEHTKEEFFHTFNTLSQMGRQIVIASDRSPRELNTLDERLRSRFQSGLIADISPPSIETRIAFLQNCREREKVNVDDEVIIYLADAIQSNMRALEGAFTRLIAQSSIMNIEITAELAQATLSDYFIEKKIRTRRVTLDHIIEAVAEKFHASPEAIKGPSRNKDIVIARHSAMYICRQVLPEVNTTLVGTGFGGRDHATVVHACQRIKMLITMDADLGKLIKELINVLN